MINLSYHLSQKIESNLIKANNLHRTILTTPINPMDETRLRWESNIDKVYWTLSLAENPISRADIIKIASSSVAKKLNLYQKEVLSYLEALKYIRENYTASKLVINSRNVLEIYNLSCKAIFGSTTNYFKSKAETVDNIIKFIESGKDHPIIKAGLMQIGITKLSPFENATGRVSKLLSQLLLTKYGFDMRNMLVMEDYYRNDLIALKEATSSVEKYKSATMWLEYYTDGFVKSAQKLLKKILENNQNKPDNKYWKLNDRQKKILERLENPNLKITNRNVQKMFNISQITASRDLSKMVNLGILLPHGKGRNVFYTKS